MPTSVLKNSATLPCHSSWQPTTILCRSIPSSHPASRTRTTFSTRSAWNISFDGWVCWHTVLGIMLRWETSVSLRFLPSCNWSLKKPDAWLKWWINYKKCFLLTQNVTTSLCKYTGKKKIIKRRQGWSMDL